MATRLSDLSFSGVGSLPGDEERKKQAAQAKKDAAFQLQEGQGRVQENLRRLSRAGAPVSDLKKYLATEDIDSIFPDDVPEDVNAGTLALGIARGAIKGTIGLAALPVMAVEGLAFGITKIFDDDASFDSFNLASSTITEGGEELGKIFDPNFSFEKGELNADKTSALPNRIAEKIGEFAAPGALITRGMTRAGARLLSKNPEAAGFFQKMFMEVAKDPKKAQMIELGINSVAASAGELTATQLAEQGVEQDKIGYYRFGAELTGVLGSVIALSTASSISNFARRNLTFTDAGRKAAAERHIGEIYSKIMAADPDAAKNLAILEKLEAQTKVKFNTVEAFQNPEFQAAFDQILATSTNAGNTKYIRILEKNRKIIQVYEENAKPIIRPGETSDIRTPLREFVDKEMKTIDDAINAAESKAVEEADLLKPNRSVTEIGDSGIMQMNALEKRMEGLANSLYNQLDPTTKFKVNHIQLAVEEARLSPTRSVARANIANEANKKPTIGLTSNQNFGTIDREVIDALDDFKAGTSTVDFQKIRELREIVGAHQRIANGRGLFNDAKRLGNIRNGIDKQLLKTSKGARTGKQASVLKEANRVWTDKNARFDKAFERLGIQRDLSNIYRFGAEDFSRIFVRTNGKKGAAQAAKDFRQIFGEENGRVLPAGQKLLEDSVALDISQLKSADGALDLKKVDNYVKNHEINLKAHGIWDQFKDVGVAAEKAKNAKDMGILDRKRYDEGIFKTIVKSKNIGNTIRTSIKNGTLASDSASIRKLDNMPANRAWARNIWDAVVDKSKKGLDTAETAMRDPDTILQTVLDNKAQLVAGLGNEHVRALTIIGRVLKRIEGRVPTKGGRTVPVESAANLGEVAASSTSKIWAAARGFVSPHFAIASIARQGVHVVNSKAARNVIEESMYDWRYAVKLAKAFKPLEGKYPVRLFRQSMIPMTQDVLNTDDERTGL